MDEKDFQRFFAAYLECAAWSSGEDAGGLPFANRPWSRDAKKTLEAHARSYLSRVWFYLDADGSAKPYHGDHYAQLGHDFWLDHNGHGAGARDGHWPKYGDMYASVAKHYPEIHLEVYRGRIVV